MRGTCGVARRTGFLCVAASVALASRSPAQVDPPRDPDAAIVRHGRTVPDPWRPLEEMDDPAVRAWIEAEDARARTFADGTPLRDRIRQSLAPIADVVRGTAPVHRGGRYFRMAFDAGAVERWVQVADDPGGPWRPLVERAELAGAGLGLGTVAPSPDGRLLLYGVTDGSSRWETLRLREVDTGRDLPDRLEGVRSGSSGVSWAADGSGFWVERFDRPDADEEARAVLRGERLEYHRLGTPQREDRVVYAPPDEGEWSLRHAVSVDGRWLVVTRSTVGRQGDAVLVADLADGATEPREILPDTGARWTFIGSRGDEIWLQTDLDAPKQRIVTLDPRRPEGLRTLVPEAGGPIDVFVGATAAAGQLVVGYRMDARLVTRGYSTTGRMLWERETPDLGSVWGYSGRQGDPVAFFNVSGAADPGSTWRLDPATGAVDRVWTPELPWDPSRFVTEQVFYEARDGTRVPMFLVHQRGLEPDGRRPVIMYAYGHGGWSAAPWFRPQMAPWMARGGVFALPNTRGGGEYGEEWHQAGVRRNKQTAIDDYLAAAEWLAESDWSAPGLVVAETNSAGGPVAGAAILQEPDRFGAAVIAFPILDMLRFDAFTGGARWRSEFGDPGDPDDFAVLASYSPVHSVRDGRCYPPTWIAPGERDQLTVPLHAYKFAAALQESQGCAAPVLLRVSWGAGHAYGADIERTLDHAADQLAFLARVLELENRPAWSTGGSETP